MKHKISTHDYTAGMNQIDILKNKLETLGEEIYSVKIVYAFASIGNDFHAYIWTRRKNEQ